MKKQSHQLVDACSQTQREVADKQTQTKQIGLQQNIDSVLQQSEASNVQSVSSQVAQNSIVKYEHKEIQTNYQEIYAFYKENRGKQFERILQNQTEQDLPEQTKWLMSTILNSIPRSQICFTSAVLHEAAEFQIVFQQFSFNMKPRFLETKFIASRHNFDLYKFKELNKIFNKDLLILARVDQNTIIGYFRVKESSMLVNLKSFVFTIQDKKDKKITKMNILHQNQTIQFKQQAPFGINFGTKSFRIGQKTNIQKSSIIDSQFLNIGQEQKLVQWEALRVGF